MEKSKILIVCNLVNIHLYGKRKNTYLFCFNILKGRYHRFSHVKTQLLLLKKKLKILEGIFIAVLMVFSHCYWPTDCLRLCRVY